MIELEKMTIDRESEEEGGHLPGAEEQATRMLPEQFKTVRGKMVRLAGKQNTPELAFISYSLSKIQGNALLTGEMGDLADFLDHVDLMYEDGFAEEESLVLPIDAFDLSANARGLIIDCDLRGYRNGFSWLLETIAAEPPYNGNLVGVLSALKEFVKTLNFLSRKGYSWNRMDGHQLFFHVEYGMFRLVYDGAGMTRDPNGASDHTALKGEITARQELAERDAAAALMFMLTGVWPDDEKVGLACCPDTENQDVFPEPEAEFPGKDAAARKIWQALPTALQKALYRSCYGSTGQCLSFEEWERILQGAMDEVDECMFCGNAMFRSASRCMCCGESTAKEDLLTKWSVQMENQSRRIRISFGRGTVLTGEMAGISTDISPCMKIMYHAKTNSLGVKNVSAIPWQVTKEGTEEMLMPGQITPIEKDMTIEFDGHPGAGMKFLGYER